MESRDECYGALDLRDIYTIFYTAYVLGSTTIS